MNTGWICPICGMVRAPHIDRCCVIEVTAKGTSPPLEAPQIAAATDATTGVARSVAQVSRAVEVPKASSKRRRFQYDDPGFNAFWKVYPRRIGKEAASKAWRNVLATGVEAQTVLDAAARYAAQVTQLSIDPKYVKYPQGWLNDGRWLDEPQAKLELVTDPAQIVGTPEWKARVAHEEARAIEAMSS